MTRSNTAPQTSNLEAAALIRAAQLKCEGCRKAWRLDGWRHRKPAAIECQAKDERQKLRDIAAASRKREQPYVLGRGVMDAINAVEGIRLDDEAKAMFDDFDRRNIPHDERRRIIMRKYGQLKKGDQQ
jgi:hypothetical protein